ncbi:hypothetical protein Anapl_05374 [Anas platyrhynchos]|uniref:Uncharacterized protein n=1 Tax=Anas platyrhynchos TaxID=8839 RepID=R0JY19_ANAPL|nr:hypothetical protein Anapl_05374 [Anas platyrhynchos]
MAGQSLLPQERRLFSMQAEWDCELRHASPLLRAGYEDSEKLSNVRVVALLCPPYVLLPCEQCSNKTGSPGWFPGDFVEVLLSRCQLQPVPRAAACCQRLVLTGILLGSSESLLAPLARLRLVAYTWYNLVTNCRCSESSGPAPSLLVAAGRAPFGLLSLGWCPEHTALATNNGSSGGSALHQPSSPPTPPEATDQFQPDLTDGKILQGESRCHDKQPKFFATGKWEFFQRYGWVRSEAARVTWAWDPGATLTFEAGTYQVGSWMGSKWAEVLQALLTSPYNMSLVLLAHGNRPTGLNETIRMSSTPFITLKCQSILSPVPLGAQKLSIITRSLYTGKHICTKSLAGVNWQRATQVKTLAVICTSCGSSPEKCEKFSGLCALKGYTHRWLPALGTGQVSPEHVQSPTPTDDFMGHCYLVELVVNKNEARPDVETCWRNRII